MKLTFDKKLFIYLSLAFILFNIIGTLSHELGHYFTARLLGYKTSISYNLSTPNAEDITKNDSLLITAGGPLQTIFFGSVGVLAALIKRKNYLSLNKLTPLLWSLIFLSLFWLREVFNFSLTAFSFLIYTIYPTQGDEIKLAELMNLPVFSISFITGTVGSLVFCLVLYFIPWTQRFTFFCALIFGGLAGYLFWMKWLGPIILPS